MCGDPSTRHPISQHSNQVFQRFVPSNFIYFLATKKVHNNEEALLNFPIPIYNLQTACLSSSQGSKLHKICEYCVRLHVPNQHYNYLIIYNFRGEGHWWNFGVMGEGQAVLNLWKSGKGHAFRYRKHKICKISNAFSAIQGAQISKFPGEHAPGPP